MTNIVQVTDIQGETVAVSTIGPTTSGTAATSAANAVAVLTGLVPTTGGTPVYTTYKVNSLLIANAGSADATVSVQFNVNDTSASTNTRTIFVNAVVIPAGATLDVLSGPVYVNAPSATVIEKIEVFATGEDVNALVSYEAIKSTTA